MTEKSFSGAYELCPTCKRRTFFKDAPWKLQCVTCYLARKGRPPITALTAKAAPIPADMLKRILYLVHPDKHNGSEAATVATRYLLALRESQVSQPGNRPFF